MTDIYKLPTGPWQEKFDRASNQLQMAYVDVLCASNYEELQRVLRIFHECAEKRLIMRTAATREAMYDTSPIYIKRDEDDED